jgi:flagellar basal body P-ring formation protein FlgA
MMGQLFRHYVGKCAAVVSAGIFVALVGASNAGAGGTLFAVVPVSVIYPGQQIARAQVKQVEVTNPDLAGDYAQSFEEVEGKVTNKTLLPDHAIYVSGLRDPFAVNRGTQVRLIFDGGSLQITALGVPLDEGAIGDVIKVRNADSGLTVSGVIVDNGVVRVVQK